MQTVTTGHWFGGCEADASGDDATRKESLGRLMPGNLTSMDLDKVKELLDNVSFDTLTLAARIQFQDVINIQTILNEHVSTRRDAVPTIPWKCVIQD